MARMELEGDLSRNQKEEVSLNVSHCLLYHFLFRQRAPVGGVSDVGGVHGGASLLFGQPGQEVPHLLAEDNAGGDKP